MIQRRLIGLLAGAALLACLAGGCTPAVTVRGAVLQPARVPIRAFPTILVVTNADPDTETLADAVARHLEGGDSTVRRLREVELDDLRDAGQVARATAVVRLRVTVTTREQARWDRRSELSCGPGGCIQRARSVVAGVPIVVGDVALDVIDGPSGRVLQRERLLAEESGPDDVAARLRVAERLVERVGELVDQRTEQVAVQLLPLEEPAVREALQTIAEGRWGAGRRQLERFVAGPAFASLPPRDQARALYDLGQARRFDRSLPAETRFDRAAEALRRAVRLTPEPRFAEALAQLDDHRRSRAMVAEQRAATAHNFALAAREREAPTPPPSYR